MIDKEDCYKLGIIQRPHGIEGDVVLKFDQNIIKAYDTMESIFIDIDGGLVPFLVYSLQESSANTLITKLELVDSPEEAAELVGQDFYVSKNVVDADEVPSSDWNRLAGFDVFDALKNHIGKTEEVIVYPNNAILRILNSSGKEILFPLDESLIQQVDAAKKIIIVDVPEGLLDLNENL